ncbi:MAG: sterol desaturase family protein [Gammaproteobacteria bacterium]|nr:sterol desaturase family protein [Gammaproteobacteria bacterium]NIM74513.1 sterol desaturase family protein [Gammaproteobacteria bacterium]NIO26346.1 sterol desaturase family protein [Gammaproteobacteria bacterium]NIO66898.1 sterol desaturase family protein [Gammaproteobacteria bacterium]NIP45208.1 sterol desaturase family protein [Gammaproteobacteria bacterium]
MGDIILSNHPGFRLGCFLLVLVSMALWEVAAPRRELKLARLARWPHNIGIVVINTLLLRVLFPSAAVGMAIVAESRGWGLLSGSTLSHWALVPLSVLVLDLAIYLQHVMFHAVPLLWRFHRMHHADLDFDVTTGVRFHPVEIVLSMLIKFAVIIALGPPALAVFLFEVILNATSMFNHGNVRIASGVDRVLRLLVVTPDMHRVHHSVEQDETNSNFGFNLPWWDRIFGTYRDQPRAGHDAMSIGIHGFTERRVCDTLPGMLMIPFSASVEGYALNRRKWDEHG